MTSFAGHIEIPPAIGFVPPALSFIEKYAEELGMEDGRRTSLMKASGQAIEMVVQSSSNTSDRNKVAIDVFEKEGILHVEVLNRGVPLLMGGTPFREAWEGVDRVSIENLGRHGQSVVLSVSLGKKALRQSLGSTVLSQSLGLSGEVAVRELEAGEEEALSQLFYFVYGYDYIHEFVYYPDKIRKMLEEKKLLSIVGALPNGRLIGHVGLMKWGDNPPVYEPCLGVVDPGLQSKGFFGKIFARMMQTVNETPMQYLFFDFVTNHDLSQRFVARYNPCEMSIFAGCQSKETQARLERLGLGPDPQDMDRYSLLFAVIPRVPHPFGKHVLLPAGLGESLGFLLKPLGLCWSPSSRFELLPTEGEFKTQYQGAQNAVVFDLTCPGRNAVERILEEWSELLRDGYEYAAIDVPVKTQGLGNLCDLISKSGFFVSGFVPYRNSAELGIRFQALGPTQVAWNDLKLFSPTAKRLLSIIRQNYERNALV